MGFYYAFISQIDNDRSCQKYENFIQGQPTVPIGVLRPQDLINEIKIMAFRFASAPGTVPERNYMANNSAQKRMSQELRFALAKNNFPAKVGTIIFKDEKYKNYK